MLILILLGHVPLLILLTLVLALYLTVIELRELRPHFLWWSWWFLLVFMTHFVGTISPSVSTPSSTIDEQPPRSRDPRDSTFVLSRSSSSCWRLPWSPPADVAEEGKTR